MDLNHLNLRVADPERSRPFYEQWFGFREKLSEDGAVFLTNDHRFLLALFPSDGPVRVPKGFHFGFMLDSIDEVKQMHRAMSDADAGARDLEEWDDFVTFRCVDADGYEIEVFWEP